VALVLGNEEVGLGAATLAACDEIVTIPGTGPVQSLKVAAAAAILIYELTRERRRGASTPALPRSRGREFLASVRRIILPRKPALAKRRSNDRGRRRAS
jgi:tRNA C32,U32 (ribose-2'-O)-methylase TrmJ